MKWAKHRAGFTIVELLIVIVVIAILAAITIVAYNGIRQNAIASSLQTDVSSAVKKIETVKIAAGTGIYPADKSAAGLTATSVNYYYIAANNTFCVEARNGNLVYSATNKNQAVTTGDCGQNGLIGWWRLNGNGTDNSSNNFTANISNVTSANGQNGQPGGSYQFSSASNSAIVVPNNPVIATEPQTFSFWVNPSSWTSATASSFIAKRIGTGSGYFIAYYNLNQNLLIDCGAGTSPNRWNPAGSTPALNQWTHIVVTCSDNTGLALYMNGVQIATRATVDRSSMNASSNLNFGRDTAGYVLDGSLDDIRLFDRVLTQQEVQNLYSTGAQ